MIERIEVIKGPFSALYGNFALAGVINFKTRRADKSPSITVRAGSYGTYQAVATISNKDWNPTPFLVWEGYNNDGYRVNSDYQRGQLFNKLTVPLWQGYLSTRLHYAARRLGEPSYIYVDDVKSGLLSRRSAANETDGGDLELFDFVMNYSPKDGEEGLYGTLYAATQNMSNAYTFPPWDQDKNSEIRTYGGWRLLYNYVPWDNFSLIVGNDTRYDDVKQANVTTQNYHQVLNFYEFYVTKQFNTAFYAQAQYKPVNSFKLVGGIRYDLFNIDINNHMDPANSGVSTPDFFSPKIGFVLTPYKDFNIFANKGTGFKTAAAYELSPVGSPKNLNLGVNDLDTWDTGFNVLLFDKKIYFAFDYYNTYLTREIGWNPETNKYFNQGTSRRQGYEMELKIFLPYNFTLYGSYSDVRARLRNPSTPGGWYIRGLNPDAATVGLDWGKNLPNDQRLDLNFYYTRYGRRPLNPLGTVIGSQVDRFFARAAYRYQNWTGSLDCQFIPRNNVSEFMRYTGFGIQYDPLPIWQFIAGLKYQFE
jgi:outer membrane receptor protein involved in Fe transport